jgi:maleylpyruvate isomerase
MDAPRQLDRDLEGVAAAHQRLLADLADLDDDTARRSSRLPDWSVGHVLTHIARNADGFVRIVEAAGRGEVAEQYEGGVPARRAAIEAGADRSAVELVADVRRGIWTLEQAWATAPASAWEGHGVGPRGDVIPVLELPFRRWREVVVHHADLGLAYTVDDWPPDYVRLELERQRMVRASRRGVGLAELPAPVLALAPPRRLAWLLGRWPVEGVADPEPF